MQFDKGQFSDLVKQAEEVQERLKRIQDDLSQFHVEGNAGAGMVVVHMNCKHIVQKVTLSPDLPQEELSVIEDLVMLAVNDAIRKVEAMVQDKVSHLSQSFQLPEGLQFPGD